MTKTTTGVWAIGLGLVTWSLLGTPVAAQETSAPAQLPRVTTVNELTAMIAGACKARQDLHGEDFVQCFKKHTDFAMAKLREMDQARPGQKD